MSTASYHRSRREAVVAAITSNVRRRLVGDHLVLSWKEVGLLFPSVVTGILRTVHRAMIRRRLGSLERADLEGVERELRASLGL